MKHNYLTLLLAVLMSIASNVVSASDFAVDGIYYNITSSKEPFTAAVTYRGSSYDSYSSEYYGNVTIPEAVTYYGKTYSVTSIGGNAFSGCSGLTSVTIPNSVTSIGGNAFYNTAWYNNQANGLVYAGKVAYKYKGTMPTNTEIILEDGTLGISDLAFYGCTSLTSVTIPESVTSIGKEAFDGCTGLTKAEFASVESLCGIAFASSFANPLSYAYHLYIDGKEVTDLVIPNSVTSISYGTFYGCSGLTSVTIPNSVTSIGKSAFYGCSGLTFINIPNSVTSIGDYAFYGCSGLTSINIPNSVTSIGTGAFYNCNSLTKAEFASIESLCKISFGNYSANPLSTAKHLYIKGEEVKDAVIPMEVKSIGNYAFDNCTGLTSVTIPNSVTSIGSSAFYGCSSLKSITIPNSVTSIGSSAFYGCTSLTSVTIPESVTSIGKEAFDGCTGLTKAEFSSIESLCKISFGNYSANPLCYAHNLYIDGKEVRDLVIPNSVTSIGHDAFYGCRYLKSVTIPNSVTSIDEGAFRSCIFLTSVTINSNTIASKTYTTSSTLANIFGYQVKNYIFGEDVKSIGVYACYNCSGLTSVTIGNSVTSIGYDAFYGCSGLTSVMIGNSVTSIGESAFDGCTGLTSIAIPNSVTSISYYAFDGCSGLTSVNIGNSVTSIGDYAFRGCSGLTSITIPNSVTSIGDDAFCGCSGLTSINIPNSVTMIRFYAFSGCSGLLSIVIGSGINYILSNAFQGCNNFDDFYCLAKNIPTLGDDVFKNSYYKYATLHVPSTLLKAYRSTAPWSEFGNIVALTEEETGLSTIDNEQLKIDKVYDFSGRKQSQPQRGINIIRMKDGTTKKVLIK